MSTQAQAGGGPGSARSARRDRAQAGSDRERAQAGSVPRIARGLEGKKIGLIIAVARAPRRRAMTFPSPIVPSWHKKKEKKRAGSELGRGFEVKSPIGRRSSRDRSDRVKPRSLIVLVLPSLAAGPSIHLRSGSYAAGVEPVWGLWDPSYYGARRALPMGPRPRRCVAATEKRTERGVPVRTLRYAREW